MNDRALLHELLDMARDGGYLLHDIWGALRGRYAVPDERAMRKLVRDAVAQLIDAGYVSVSYGYYDWHNAMTYADTWALGFNTASYRTQTGDDCTNFVSQALKAGTWQDAGGWYTDDHAWWYNSLTQTYTWVGVLHLLNFMSYSGRAQFMPYLTDMLIGDVIQVNGQIQHSMIVDDRWGGTLDQIFIDYHSNPNKHRPLVDFLGDVPISQNSYYAEHILGTY